MLTALAVGFVGGGVILYFQGRQPGFEMLFSIGFIAWVIAASILRLAC